MDTDDNKLNVTSTTPPIAPTEPAPIPLEDDVTPTFSTGDDNKKYYCPMHCEGDKVYDEPGNCPVCGMKLVRE